jgi:ASCH domain
MKMLTIRQPWAGLIVAGIKPVENRTWSTDYRGPILIHAGLKWEDRDTADVICEMSPGRLREMLPDDMRTGAVIGVADLVDVVEHHRSKYFTGPYAFVLDNARRLPYVTTSGSLGLREAPARVLAQLKRDGVL